MLTIGIGTRQPPNPALRGFVEGCEDQPQPCWYGIVPGKTTVAQTQSTLLGLGYTPFRRSSYGVISYGVAESIIDCNLRVTYTDSTGPIQALNFQECSSVRFGDLGVQLSRPNWLQPHQGRNILIYNFRLDLLLEGGRLSAYNPVSSFHLRSTESVEFLGTVAWRGFMQQERYCRQQMMQHGISGC